MYLQSTASSEEVLRRYCEANFHIRNGCDTHALLRGRARGADNNYQYCCRQRTGRIVILCSFKTVPSLVDSESTVKLEHDVPGTSCMRMTQDRLIGDPWGRPILSSGTLSGNMMMMMNIVSMRNIIVIPYEWPCYQHAGRKSITDCLNNLGFQW